MAQVCRIQKRQEIFALAQHTEFLEGARVEITNKGGSIEYVQRTFVSFAIWEALAQGILLFRFTIKSEPLIFPQLAPSTYHVMLDFLAGGVTASKRRAGSAV